MVKEKKITEFSIGARVEIPEFKRRGIISEGPNNRDEYAVQMGPMSIWVATDKLKALSAQEAKSPIKKKETEPTRKNVIRRKAQNTTGKHSGESTSIDLHGFTKSEAIELLETTLDRAILNDNDSIEIIHGLGTGALKAAVEKYLTSCRHVAHYQLMPNNPGTTIAYLK